MQLPVTKQRFPFSDSERILYIARMLKKAEPLYLYRAMLHMSSKSNSFPGADGDGGGVAAMSTSSPVANKICSRF